MSSRDRERGRAIAAHVARHGPLTLPALARTFEERGYALSQFIGGLAAAFDAGLLDRSPDPTWNVRAAP